MNWYIAKLIFNIHIDNGNDISQFDEQCRLIAANSEQEALIKARTIGKSEEESFLNSRKMLVSWNFIDVLEICSIKEWKDGSNIYSRTHEIREPEEYIRYVRAKGSAQFAIQN